MLAEVIAGASCLLPLDEQRRGIARAAMMRDWHMAGIPNLTAEQVDSQADVRIVNVEEKLLVHAA